MGVPPGGEKTVECFGYGLCVCWMCVVCWTWCCLCWAMDVGLPKHEQYTIKNHEKHVQKATMLGYVLVYYWSLLNVCLLVNGWCSNLYFVNWSTLGLWNSCSLQRKRLFGHIAVDLFISIFISRDYSSHQSKQQLSIKWLWRYVLIQYKYLYCNEYFYRMSSEQSLDIEVKTWYYLVQTKNKPSQEQSLREPDVDIIQHSLEDNF